MSVIARTASRYCLTCNQAFVPFNGSLYCSQRCQKRMNNLRRADKLRAQAQPLVCPSCRREFHPLGNQRYCSQACKPQSIRRIPRTPRACAECGVAFTPQRTDGTRGRYCSTTCRNQAEQMTVKPLKKIIERDTEQAKSWTAVVPRNTCATRAGQFTEEAFRDALKRERWLLDNEDQHPDDKHWRKKAGGE
jgi:hypothetical protein